MSKNEKKNCVLHYVVKGKKGSVNTCSEHSCCIYPQTVFRLLLCLSVHLFIFSPLFLFFLLLENWLKNSFVNYIKNWKEKNAIIAAICKFSKNWCPFFIIIIILVCKL